MKLFAEGLTAEAYNAKRKGTKNLSLKLIFYCCFTHFFRTQFAIEKKKTIANCWNILLPLQTRMSAFCAAAAGIYEPEIFKGNIPEERILKYL